MVLKDVYLVGDFLINWEKNEVFYVFMIYLYNLFVCVCLIIEIIMMIILEVIKFNWLIVFDDVFYLDYCKLF